jgi:hypothetical protein
METKTYPYGPPGRTECSPSLKWAMGYEAWRRFEVIRFDSIRSGQLCMVLLLCIWLEVRD